MIVSSLKDIPEDTTPLELATLAASCTQAESPEEAVKWAAGLLEHSNRYLKEWRSDLEMIIADFEERRSSEDYLKQLYEDFSRVTGHPITKHASSEIDTIFPVSRDAITKLILRYQSKPTKEKSIDGYCREKLEKLMEEVPNRSSAEIGENTFYKLRESWPKLDEAWESLQREVSANLEKNSEKINSAS